MKLSPISKPSFKPKVLFDFSQTCSEGGDFLWIIMIFVCFISVCFYLIYFFTYVLVFMVLNSFFVLLYKKNKYQPLAFDCIHCPIVCIRGLLFVNPNSIFGYLLTLQLILKILKYLFHCSNEIDRTVSTVDRLSPSIERSQLEPLSQTIMNQGCQVWLQSGSDWS